MSRVHLGMKRPIRQFEKSYNDLLSLIKAIEDLPPTEGQKEFYIKRVEQVFNNALVQLNNIKNTQIEYLRRKYEDSRFIKQNSKQRRSAL